MSVYIFKYRILSIYSHCYLQFKVNKCIKNFDINETQKLYRSMLPHGAMTVIAEHAGVTKQAVSQFFAGKSNSKAIEDVTLEYIVELRLERESKLRKAGLLL